MYKVDFEKPIHVYFMGIGGISMSGLAEILLQEGFTVSGSDMKESEITEILKNLGARIFIGQKVSPMILISSYIPQPFMRTIRNL